METLRDSSNDLSSSRFSSPERPMTPLTPLTASAPSRPYSASCSVASSASTPCLQVQQVYSLMCNYKSPWPQVTPQTEFFLQFCIIDVKINVGAVSRCRRRTLLLGIFSTHHWRMHLFSARNRLGVPWTANHKRSGYQTLGVLGPCARSKLQHGDALQRTGWKA
jgi:hypothetical protein